jgi:hypothetical protein
MRVGLSKMTFSKFLCCLTIAASSLPGDFLNQDPGERGGFRATELGAFAAIGRDNVQQVVAVNAPHTVAVIGS